MKKTALVLALMSILLFLVVGAHFVSLAEANGFIGTYIDPPPGTIPAKITILTPKNYTVYPSGNLNFTGIVAMPEGDYSVENAYLSVESYVNPGSHYLHQSYTFSASEVEFSRVLKAYSGSNELVIKVVCVIEVVPRTFFRIESNSTVYFTVVDVTAPVIFHLSIENKTYSKNDLSLYCAVDELISWKGYSLDEQANVTVTKNFTPIKIASGSHTLTVYANDTSGNMGASETIYFTIAESHEPFPTSLVVASSVTAAVVLVGLGLLVYFIKRK